jgi:hypothetical protein
MTNTDKVIYTHPSGDRILSLMGQTEGIISDFVKAYPGKLSSDSSLIWLDSWFRERTGILLNKNDESVGSYEIDDLLESIAEQRDPIISKPAKIASLCPHYFRGFRSLSQPIQFIGDLVVIDGRNSSGKTSLSEALEWLLTGQLIRRHIQQYGDARELENCITNQLRPDEESTWVEAVFVTETGENIVLMRMLKKDYGSTQTSKADSVLYLNGKELGLQAETEILDDLFAGIPPILMQHSLRLFVNSSCVERRNYFEKLLRMDELTSLVEKAVIGDAHLAEFPTPSGSIAYKRWENLRASVKQTQSKTILRNATRVSEEELEKALQEALLQIAKLEFPEQIKLQVTLEQMAQSLKL